jgi:hypothetical protein
MGPESCMFPAYLVASEETREAISKSIKDGVENIKKHPEMLGTGNPKVYEEGLKVIEKSVEKAAHKVMDFFKDTIKFTREHPDMLLASAKPKVSIFDE